MTQTVALKDMREQLSELVSRVAYGDQKVVITKFGKPLAALVAYDDYEKLMNPARRMSKEEWEKGFVLMDKMRENTKRVPAKQLQQAINQAIREVRNMKKRV